MIIAKCCEKLAGVVVGLDRAEFSLFAAIISITDHFRFPPELTGNYSGWLLLLFHFSTHTFSISLNSSLSFDRITRELKIVVEQTNKRMNWNGRMSTNDVFSQSKWLSKPIIAFRFVCSRVVIHSFIRLGSCHWMCVRVCCTNAYSF